LWGGAFKGCGERLSNGYALGVKEQVSDNLVTELSLLKAGVSYPHILQVFRRFSKLRISNPFTGLIAVIQKSGPSYCAAAGVHECTPALMSI